MRAAGIQGLHRRKFHGCTRRDPDATPAEDLVNRNFAVDGPDRLWVSDITEHATAEGKVYVAVVVDAWSRRVVGWSIADHIRAELVVDALQMATWRRRPPAGQAVFHSTTEASTRRGPSGADSGRPACWAPWARSATVPVTLRGRRHGFAMRELSR